MTDTKYATRPRAADLDSDALDRYWEGRFRTREYVGDDDRYDTYRPAYHLGWRRKMQNLDARWEAFEDDLEREWEKLELKTKLGWERAKLAVQDAWHDIERRLPGDFDDDGR